MEERTTNPARMPRKLAMVITATSRWATCDSSCDSTASSSGADSRRRIPVVTQTTACCWLRPVAKALGMSESAIATLGLGMLARAHSRSTVWWSSGACSGDTTRPRIADRARRSEKKYWKNRNPPAIRTISSQLLRIAMSTATNTTYSRPSRNIVPTMRLVRPWSAGNRVRAISVSPRDEPLVAEDLANFMDGGVGAGQDQVGGADPVGRELLAGGADAGQQGLQGRLELGLVAGVDRLGEVVVEPVELVDVVLGEVELALAADPDDHRRSSSTGAWAGAGAAGAAAAVSSSGAPSCLAVVLPPVSSPLSRASSASTAGSAKPRSSSAWSRSLDMEASSSAPEAISSSRAPERACIWATLSSARCMARPTSPISSPIPEMASLTLVWASAAV